MPSNPYYFKTSVVSFYHALLALMGLGILLYNAVNRKVCKKYMSKMAIICTGLLGVPIIVDSIYDVAIEHNPANFDPATLIVIGIIMTIATALATTFLVMTAKKCDPTVSCKKKGYTALSMTTEDENGEERRKMDKTEMEKLTLYPINMLMLVNLTVSLVVVILVTTICYFMRVGSYYDRNKVRELDSLYFALVMIGLHVAFFVMDIVWRKNLMGIVCMHHFTLGIYLLSNTVEIHKSQSVIEKVGFLGFLLLSVPLSAIKLSYFFVMRNNFGVSQDPSPLSAKLQ